MTSLRAVAGLGLPDCWLAAGFVRNMVWDAHHGYPATPLNDLDVIFYDPDDADGVRARTAECTLGADYPVQNWDVRNQALMHLGNGDAPYLDSSDAMTYWPEVETAVGARLDEIGRLHLLAPLGTESLLAGHITHNPKRSLEVFTSRVTSKNWLLQWPKLRVVA